jgi:hypothetical protein
MDNDSSEFLDWNDVKDTIWLHAVL